MCGIVYGKNKNNKDITGDILKVYNNQKHRGQDGFGFLSITPEKVSMFRGMYEQEIRKYLSELDERTEVLFHHRYPTSTPNLREASHPIKVCHDSLKYNYYIVHNGIITNSDELYDKHISLGFNYTTKIVTQTITTGETYEEYCFNDSESFAIELALYLEGKKESIDSMGSIAFMAVKTNKKDKPIALLYGRNSGNPLKLKNTNNITIISSESNSEKTTSIEPDIIFSQDYISGVVSEISVNIGIYTKPTQTIYHNVCDDMNEMGFRQNYIPMDNSLNEDYHFDDMEESYWELLDEQSQLQSDIKDAERSGDIEMVEELKKDLWYVSEAIKDYEKRYNL